MTDDELRALSDSELENERRKAAYVRIEYYPRIMREVWRRIEIKRKELQDSDGLEATSRPATEV